jgi:hypothetical protein
MQVKVPLDLLAKDNPMDLVIQLGHVNDGHEDLRI